MADLKQFAEQLVTNCKVNDLAILKMSTESIAAAVVVSAGDKQQLRL
jgi:hypothetical protein